VRRRFDLRRVRGLPRRVAELRVGVVLGLNDLRLPAGDHAERQQRILHVHAFGHHPHRDACGRIHRNGNYCVQGDRLHFLTIDATTLRTIADQTAQRQ